jgi:GTP-binding protein EngB required for normal cell division/Flp pilus assembly protein TadD
MALFDNILATLTGGESLSESVRKEIAQALACAEEGELVIAEARLLALTDDNPDVAAVFQALGEVRARRGHDEDAVEAYGRAVNLAKNTVEAWLGLGEALVRLRRPEPARDALRRVLAGTADTNLMGRAHAARARLALDAGRAGEAVRELRKATEACPRDRELAAALGRALLAAGDQEGWRWLVHAAQDFIESKADGTRSAADLLVEAANACPEAVAAESLLRAGLAAIVWSTDLQARLQAALAGRLEWAGQGDEARALAAKALAANPEDAFVLAVWRGLAEASGDFTGALAAAKREAELGAPAPASTIVRLALAAESRADLQNVQARLAEESAELAPALAAWLNGSAREHDLLTLAPLARNERARGFLAQALAPGAPPEGNLAGLLAYACDLATRSPELQSVLPAAIRAAEALQRPLRVAVMGEFNAGKSSFVNALCGAEIARVGVTPTTATINLLRFGEPGGRVHFHDGRVEDRDAAEIRSFVAALDEAAAGAVRMVEIFHPLPVLQKTEVVDTPGTNSLRPEHERVARTFLVEADAIVWVFSLAQAGKESERGVLNLAHAAGKRVLGVLNKADQASPDEVAQVLTHLSQSLGDRVVALLPLSARAALLAQLAGDQDRWRNTGMPEVHAALQERFFQHAESLKQHTAQGALARFVAEAEALAQPAPVEDLVRHRAELDACEARVNAALARERLNLPANLDDGFRRAAVETLALARPRVWPLGEPRALAADQEYLLDLLEEAIASATEATKASLLAEAAEAPTLPIAPMVDQFAAYARGMLTGCLTDDFLRQFLSRPGRADALGAAAALTRRLPDAEAELFSPLAAKLRRVFASARAQLASHADRQAMAATLLEARLARPLSELRACLAQDDQS